jgi:galactokinase
LSTTSTQPERERGGSALARAPGRICLAGEDLDWLGGSNVLAAVDLHVDAAVTGTGAPGTTLRSRLAPESRTVSLTDPSRYAGGFLDVIEATCRVTRRRWGVDLEGIDVETSGSLPAGAGLSSSAATALAVLAAINSAFARGEAVDGLCDLAYEVEAGELQTGAGQMDFYAVGHGGVVVLDCGTRPPRVERLSLPTGIGIMIGDTGLRRSTGSEIGEKRRRRESGDPALSRYAERTGSLAQAMTALLRREPVDVAELGRLVSRCHEALRDDLRASVPTVDAAVDAALAAGALGAKLTGAGGGGCMVALVDAGSAEPVAAALQGAGVELLRARIEPEGVRRVGEPPMARLS